MSAKPIISLLVLAAVAVALWFGLRESTETPTTPLVKVVPKDPATPPTEPALRKSESPLVDPNVVPQSERVALPDGTWVRALNGATDIQTLGWPKDVPWAPIVATEIDTNGIEWFVHADGTKSTMGMAWRDDLGRYDGYTSVAKPTETLPVMPPESEGSPRVGPTLPAGSGFGPRRN